MTRRRYQDRQIGQVLKKGGGYLFLLSCLLIIAVVCGLASLIADIAVIWLFTHYMKDQYKEDNPK